LVLLHSLLLWWDTMQSTLWQQQQTARSLRMFLQRVTGMMQQIWKTRISHLTFMT
jgi:monosaccharide ABC transporter substrate-binding protein, CUT2 family (TC 3.A.1.2.-)